MLVKLQRRAWLEKQQLQNIPCDELRADPLLSPQLVEWAPLSQDNAAQWGRGGGICLVSGMGMLTSQLTPHPLMDNGFPKYSKGLVRHSLP